MHRSEPALDPRLRTTAICLVTVCLMGGSSGAALLGDDQPAFPYQFFLPPVEASEGLFTGIALFNPEGEAVEVRVERVELDTGTILSQSELELQPGAQLAKLFSELPGMSSGRDAASWIRVRSRRSDTVVMAQIGDYSLNRLDGVLAQRRSARHLLLAPVLSGTVLGGRALTSQISIINPTEVDSRVLISFDHGDGRRSEETLDLGSGRGSVIHAAGPTGSGSGAGWVEIQALAGEGVVGFLQIGAADGATLLMLPGLEPGRFANLWSPQFATLPGLFSSWVSLVNPLNRAVDIGFEAITEDGHVAYGPVQRQMDPGSGILLEAREIFEFGEDGFVGTLKVTVKDAFGVNGAVVFGRSDLASAAAAVLDGLPSPIARFGHVASYPDRFYTGVALVNPGPDRSEIGLSVRSVDGSEVASAAIGLPAGGRLSKVLPELAESMGSLNMEGGSIVISASSPVLAQELFGTQSGNLLSAVPASREEVDPLCRDARRWPFRTDSIWNLPLGEGALLVPAGLQAPLSMGMTVDEDVLILHPDAPGKPVMRNTAGWDRNKSRCGTVTDTRVFEELVPVPDDFSTDPGFLGLTPNMSAALLLADGVTVKQTQPFHICGPGGTVTSQYVFPDVHLRDGDGIRGAHGGSGMSSLGGTVRLGELVPGGVIRHALKVNLFARKYLHYSSGEATPGYRWPAVVADGYAGNSTHPCAYGGENPELQMGALLALDRQFDLGRLRTEPARILARAFMDYGAYVVDDTCWDVFAVATEWSPDGRVIDEFKEVWGWPMETAKLSSCREENPECLWARDIADLLQAMQVVINNSMDRPGGGGVRYRPLAPPFCE